MTRRVGRPSATEPGRDTSADILEAARELFADLGFDKTSMRAVAARAGVDVALIYHHFGSKDDLLAAALSVPEGAESVRRAIGGDTPDPGTALVRAVLGMWEDDPALRRQALAMFRTAVTHDLAAQRVQALHTAYVLDLIEEVVRPDHRELRAGLIGAELHGLLAGRYLFHVQSLATADVDTIATAVGPTIDHYLTSDLGLS